MKTRFLIILLILASMSILFTACPYSSSVPLSQPTEKIDASIYGKWLKQDEYSDFPKYYIFSEIDGKKVKVEQYEFNSTDSIYSVSGTYIAHFTTIGNVKFANMMQDGTYYFYKMDFSVPEQFKLFEVTDNIDETFENSKDLYEFFKTHKDLSFFYNKDEETYKHIKN